MGKRGYAKMFMRKAGSVDILGPRLILLESKGLSHSYPGASALFYD